jgi:integrase
MALTAITAKNAQATDRDYKLFDSQGLFLLVTKAGTRSWRYKYRYGGKEKLLTFGQYPGITLAGAREQRDKARGVLREGKDPAHEAQKLKRALIAASNTSFRSVAEAWFEDEVPGWSISHAKRVKFRLEKDIYPEFGKLPISEIDSRAILAALRKIERRGSIETAKRVRGYIFAIFERAIGECLIDDDVNPAIRVAKSLKKTPVGAKQPALTDVPSLIRLQQDIDNSTSRVMTKLASRLLALTTVRVGVIVGARWEEFEGIDWDRPDAPVSDATWRVPAARMKLSVEDKGNDGFGHDVPLAPQAVAVLRALRLFSGFRDLVFPNDKRWREPMSDAAISTMYKRLRAGVYRHKMVPHGWRAAFSTVMNERAAELERDGDRLIIDMILAHVPAGISASEWAYNRARYRKPRAELLQVWADIICEGLKEPMSLIGADEGRVFVPSSRNG